MIRNRIIFVGTVLLSSMAMAACTHGPRDVAGIRHDGGQTKAVVYLCPGSTLVTVSVFQDGSGGRAWQVDPPSDDKPASYTVASTVEVELFSTPTAWTASGTTLSALSADQTYGLAGITSAGNKFNVYFTVKDLAGLRSGEMLVADGHKAKVTTESSLQHEAARNCT